MVSGNPRVYPIVIGLLLTAGVVGCSRTPAAGNPPLADRAEASAADTPTPSGPPAANPAQPADPKTAPNDLPPEKKGPAFLDAAAKHDGKTLVEWTARLGDADDLARSAAAEAVAKYGPNAKAAVPALAKILASPKDAAWFNAIDAVKAVGPAAGDAMDTLIGLLRDRDPGVRLTAAYALADLGPAAGRAVSVLIGRLDDRAATAGGGTVRDAALSSIEQLGKYDIRAVFAAERQRKLTDLELSTVIDSLGPGDGQAVDGLVEVVKRKDDTLFHALGGLKRIGPKAAPSLPVVRALLNDPSPEVRKSAAEVIAAIGPVKADDPPPAAPRGGPAAGPNPAGPDPAVAAVIGAESAVYKEAGYKGVALGTRFDELAKDKGLKLTRVGQPWVFASGPKGEEEFVFDADKKLACYTRSYDGGPDDYLDQLTDLFGKADRPPRETVTSSPASVTRRTAVDYTFPKVLARVVFVRAARQGPLGGMPVVEEQTHVAVIDRAWAAGILDANARGKRKAIEWVRAAGEKVKGGEVVLKDLPRLDGAAGREFQVGVPVRFFDTRTEEENKDREMGRQPLPVATVEKTVRPGDPERKPVVRVNFTFARYSPLATPKVYRQDEVQKGAVVPKTGNNALDYTPFGNLVTELNVALMRDAFPPTGGRVEHVRPPSGPPFYEWRTEDGWAVRCGTNDGVTIEWVGKKGL
jgi:hypothetical protein